MLLIKILFFVVLSVVAVLVMTTDVRKQSKDGLSTKYKEKYHPTWSK